MSLAVVQRILGLLLMLFSCTMLPPIAVSLYAADGEWQPFADAFVALLAAGTVIWWPVRTKVRELRLRDGFLVVALFWVVLGIAGAAPLVLSERPVMSVTDAVFEAVSGFTTTGATVLVGLDALPASILYYRHQIQWLGGIGMIVLAVALLPMLGVGGMQLLRAETPGPVKDSKLTPRITETAKALWLIYVVLTIACIAAYWLAGMTPFEAVGHGLSTVATGGFSSHDTSLAYFANPVIEIIAMVFMLLGAINFALHFTAWRHRRLGDYLRDPELRAFAAVLLAATVVYTAVLWATGTKPPADALRSAAFQAVSIQTSSGFLTDDFSLWPAALPVIVMLSTFIGGCAGSTSGGMKVIRFLLMWKQGQREVTRLVHPSAELPVKIGAKAVNLRVIDAVWGFFAVYVVSFGVLMVLLMAMGEDQVTAFSAIASCMNNTGPALGEVATGTFTSVSDAGKWVCVIAMLLGRLEVFPLLVLISPTFWRR